VLTSTVMSQLLRTTSSNFNFKSFKIPAFAGIFFLPEEKRLKTDLLNSELKIVTKFLLCFECCLSIQAFNHKLIDIQGSNWRNELF